MSILVISCYLDRFSDLFKDRADRFWLRVPLSEGLAQGSRVAADNMAAEAPWDDAKVA